MQKGSVCSSGCSSIYFSSVSMETKLESDFLMLSQQITAVNRTGIYVLVGVSVFTIAAKIVPLDHIATSFVLSS